MASRSSSRGQRAALCAANLRLRFARRASPSAGARRSASGEREPIGPPPAGLPRADAAPRRAPDPALAWPIRGAITSRFGPRGRRSYMRDRHPRRAGEIVEAAAAAWSPRGHRARLREAGRHRARERPLDPLCPREPALGARGRSRRRGRPDRRVGRTGNARGATCTSRSARRPRRRPAALLNTRRGREQHPGPRRKRTTSLPARSLRLPRSLHSQPGGRKDEPSLPHCRPRNGSLAISRLPSRSTWSTSGASGPPRDSIEVSIMQRA